jgi:methyltransferase (TIGR00027 family)
VTGWSLQDKTTALSSPEIGRRNSERSNTVVEAMMEPRAKSLGLPQSSRTAELMAVQRGLETCHPDAERLFADPLAPLFVRPEWRLALGAAHIGPVRRLIERLFDAAGGPGPRASAVARTRLIDDLLADVAGEATQLVILGAGFDSRTYRLPALTGCAVYELDLAATQDRKRRRLANVRRAPVCPVRYVAVDFERDDLERALLTAGYDPMARSVILWEGVTNYLTAAAVDATLAAICRLAVSGSTLVFTYVDRAALARGAAAFPEAGRWIESVTRRGEPWTFGLDPAQLDDFLGHRGFALTSNISTEQAGERYFPARGRPERGSRLYYVATATVSSPT